MESPHLDMATAAKRLSEAIRFRTVSSVDAGQMRVEEFLSFQAWLTLSYPRTHAACERETFGPWGLLLRLPGVNPALKPLLLLAHYDVVPAEDPESWTYPPFGGRIADGYVWGRGALDVKNSVVSIMEAVEGLLAEGRKPERGILIAFGGDEEIGGSNGAASIAKRLADMGMEPECLIDEGSVIAQGFLPFLKAPAALIGLAEKGFLNVALETRGAGGHASMPGRGTAAGRLARALAWLERRPFPARLTSTLALFLKSLSPHAPTFLRAAFAFPRLSWPLLTALLSASPRTDALQRTTQAITMLQASPKENVLPLAARAVVNLRTLPGESTRDATERLRALLSPFGVCVDVFHPEHMNEAMGQSPVDVPAYRAIVSALKEAVPEAVALPFLTTVGTDTHHYSGLTDRIYRIMPVILDEGEIGRIHGTDERISVENLGREILFYRSLIRAGA